MSDHHDDLRAELAALVAATPPTGDRSSAVTRRIHRIRRRRLMLASIGGVCAVLLLVTAIASRSRGGGSDVPALGGNASCTTITTAPAQPTRDCAEPAPTGPTTTGPTTIVPTTTGRPPGHPPRTTSNNTTPKPADTTVLASDTSAGVTLTIAAQFRPGEAAGEVRVDYLITVHGNGKPVCGSSLSFSTSNGSAIFPCGTTDDTTISVLSPQLYPIGTSVTETATFRRQPGGSLTTGPGMPAPQVQLTATAVFTAPAAG